MKRIYFACSIRGGRDDAELYGQLVAHIGKHATVLTEIFADKTLTPLGMNKPATEIWQTDLAWVRQADAIIAEVTNPSLGVGYEIAKAEEWGKPILALYRPQDGRKLSAMILGNPKVVNQEYRELPEAYELIERFVSGLQNDD